MAIRIVLYEPRHEPAVKAFHERLRAAGSLPFRLSEEAPPIDPEPMAVAAGITFRHFVVEDDEGAVRGGYFVRTQRFIVNGTIHTVGHYTSPLSEGIADKRYTTVGLQMISHALKWQPLLFAMGMGGLDRPLPRILKSMGWMVRETPFYFLVLNGARFLRNIGPLRKTAARRVGADFLAFSGLGGFGIRLLQQLKLLRTARSSGRSFVPEPVESYTAWADDVWQESAPQYSFSAVRDASYLQFAYPEALSRTYPAVRVMEGGKAAGWVSLMVCRPHTAEYFGDMKVMALLDGVADSAAIPALIAAAVRKAREERADLLFSNQMHRDWTGALQRAGFWHGPSNYLLALSKPLAQLVGPATDRIHFNRGDGDGRVNLL